MKCCVEEDGLIVLRRCFIHIKRKAQKSSFDSSNSQVNGRDSLNSTIDFASVGVAGLALSPPSNEYTCMKLSWNGSVHDNSNNLRVCNLS